MLLNSKHEDSDKNDFATLEAYVEADHQWRQICMASSRSCDGHLQVGLDTVARVARFIQEMNLDRGQRDVWMLKRDEILKEDTCQFRA